MRRMKWLFLAPLALIGFALFVALGGEIVKLLWNWLMPAIFGWKAITFWQALGLLALCRILFGGFGHRGVGRSRIRSRMAERWEQMGPDDRERFRAGIRARCGLDRPTPAPPAD